MSKHYQKPLSSLAASMAASLVLLVAACSPLISFGDSGPGPDSYTLRYPASYDEVSAEGPSLYLDSPRMASGMDSQSIAVRLPGNQRTVLEGARWAQHSSEILRDYLEHSIAALADMKVVSEGGLDIRVGCRLGVKVWAMELVPGDTAANDSVEVALQFSLVRLTDSELLGQPVFAETTPVNGSSGDAVVRAFSTALEKASRRYGAWVRQQRTACQL